MTDGWMDVRRASYGFHTVSDSLDSRRFVLDHSVGVFESCLAFLGFYVTSLLFFLNDGLLLVEFSSLFLLYLSPGVVGHLL